MRRMSPNATSTPEQVQEAAALWFARLRGDAVDASTRAEFAAWLAAAPEHAEEYALLEQLWDNAARLQPSAPGSRLRLAGVLLAAIALSIGWYAVTVSPDTTLATVAGERQHVRLDDGSELDLAPQTQVHVHLGKMERHIELTRGSMAVAVAADQQRPFEVAVAGNRIRDIGTHFTVDYLNGKVSIGVAEGIVEVTPGDERQATQILRAGETLSIVDGKTHPASQADRNKLLAWTKGQLVFEDAPLEEVIAALNRFRRTPIVLADRHGSRLRISGVFLVDDEKVAPLALQRIAGLRFEEADGQLLAHTP